MIKQLLATPLLGPLVSGMLGEAPGYVPPPPPPPPQVPQGTITFQTPTVTDTTIQQPFSYDASDFTGFYAKLNNGVQVEASSPVMASALTPETTYSIKVAAYNATGIGAWVETFITTEAAEPPPPPPPQVPIGTTAITSTTPTQTTCDVAFTYTVGANGVDYVGFEFQLNSGSWSAAPAAPGTFTLADLAPATAYTLYMRAYNGVGPGAVSAAVNFNTPATPPPPPTTRWQYTLDRVDDRYVCTFPLVVRSFTGVYIIEFEIVSTPVLAQQGIICQAIGTAAADTDFYLGRTSSQATWDLIIFGTPLLTRTFSNGVTMGPGIWQFEINMATRDTIIRKNGFIGGQAIRTFTNTDTKAANFHIGNRIPGDRYFNGCIRNFKVWTNGVLTYSNDLKDKDEVIQVPTVGPVGYPAGTCSLQNQNPANWAEVPL